MENRLTRALGCGDISSVAEYERITRAILGYSLLYKKVLEDLIWERGPAVIANMHRLEIEAFQKSINFVRKNPQIRIVWEWIPPFRTLSGAKPQVRASRYFGESQTPEEKMFWDPARYTSVEAFSQISEPWTHSLVTSEVVIAFGNWLNGPSEEYVQEMRRVNRDQAEVAQKKQGTLTGDVAVAVNIQRGSDPDYVHDNAPVNKPTEAQTLLEKADALIGGRQ